MNPRVEQGGDRGLGVRRYKARTQGLGEAAPIALGLGEAERRPRVKRDRARSLAVERGGALP